MKISQTKRGFNTIQFKDVYDVECSIQESSLASEPAIWLGVNDANPQVLASSVKEGATGWIPYPIPDSVTVSFKTRMHLTRDQVAELMPVLQRFIDTGEIA